MLRQTCAVLLRRRTCALRPFATKPDLTLVADRDGIRTITMNNPAKYNGWTDPMLRSWMGRFADAAADDGRNASIGGLVEFASEADYRAYAKDPAHVAVIKDYILPHMAEGGRAALQTADHIMVHGSYRL